MTTGHLGAQLDASKLELNNAPTPKFVPNPDSPKVLGLYAYYSYNWAPDSKLDLFADTRWAALCAILKEEIIVELFGEERFDNRVEKASHIQRTAELQWSLLSKHFRLDMRMKSCDRTAAELDLILDIKLNYLHHPVEYEVAATPKVLRDLGVLVAEIEYGALVYKEDANYPSLAGATQTIKNILDNISASRLDQPRLGVQAPDVTVKDDPELDSASWDLWSTGNLQYSSILTLAHASRASLDI
ncbi:hypothetical protein DER46DRAFT_697846 [Fusarium sp. MPI-SDFR-AT-0072]|nr:hypothetical protein DER46DRAFT_697846 [Fusarium sp. MPI-SDFR-AT-0072]